MSFAYTRKIYLQDTDAAGVTYFATMLKICHEAYEDSLAASGIHLQEFIKLRTIALPIVHAEVDFYQPVVCGDLVTVILVPHQLKPSEFELNYQILLSGQVEMHSSTIVAQAKTCHVCIEPITRQRHDMPTTMIEWLRRWSFGE